MRHLVFFIDLFPPGWDGGQWRLDFDAGRSTAGIFIRMRGQFRCEVVVLVAFFAFFTRIHGFYLDFRKLEKLK
jgi:hypothetical protein